MYILEHLEGGSRMDKPRYCPDSLYKVMKECWIWQADRRPPFSQLLRKLNSIYAEREEQVRARNATAPPLSQVDRLANQNTRKNSLAESSESEIDLNEAVTVTSGNNQSFTYV